VLAAVAVATALALLRRSDDEWSGEELAVLRSLAIPLDGWRPPPDPSNRFADRADAARLGRALFSDTALSANGRVSCATCHKPELDFQDGRRRGRGLATVPRRTMTLVGAAGQPWLFWDGRKDSLWSQALGPLENAKEHGLTRVEVVRAVARDHRAAYEAVFGPLPRLDGLPRRASPLGDAAARRAWARMRPSDRHAVSLAFANVGKAIEAFERGIRPQPARFDRYVAGAGVLSEQELAGLRLFVDEGHCVDCHSGPLFTNGEFHVTGRTRDPGRAAALALVRADEFNCLGPFSDAPAEDCAVRFLPRTAHRGAFKPPSLRNVTRRAPYLHAGQIATLGAVLRRYDEPPREASELHALHLGDDQLDQLAAFLKTLES
jgi:cytochrome c peroxidase